MKIPNITILSILLLISSSPLFADTTTATDAKIQQAAMASYNYKTVLEDRVDVSVKNGVVTLTGTVPDKDLKNLAEDTVNNLPGVVRVDNQIVVKEVAPEHSDGWIAFKIHFQLLVHAHVSATGTTVDVKDGVVTLSGTAENQAQKDLTAVYTKNVEGVKSVTNNITIVTPPATPKGESSSQYIDDASITTQIKYELATHKSTSAVKTKVVTTNGVVEITGPAQSDAEKSLVTMLAQGIRGVQSVSNDMVVVGK